MINKAAIKQLIIDIINIANLVIFLALCIFPGKSVMSQHKRFVKIFDGKTLKGWKGDTEHWKVEEGLIVGEVTPEKQLKENTFLIWEGAEVDNFELKIQYKILKEVTVESSTAAKLFLELRSA